MAYTYIRHLGDAVQLTRTPKQKRPCKIYRVFFALTKRNTKRNTDGKHINIFIGDLYSYRG